MIRTTRFYAVLRNVESDTWSAIPASRRRHATAICVRARRRDEVRADVVGRLDGGVRDADREEPLA